VNVHVQGQLVFNSSSPILKTALAGFWVAYIPEDMAQDHIKEGSLHRVLDDWCPSYQGIIFTTQVDVSLRKHFHC